MTRVDTFYYDTKIRLKTIHRIVDTIVTNDRNDESFDINSPDLTSIPWFDSVNMTVEILRFEDPIDKKVYPPKDNIVRITDNKSNPSNPFIFQFARMNRPPIVGETGSPRTVSLLDTLTQDDFNDIEVYDPDEEIITKYFYSDEIPFVGSKINPGTYFSYEVTALAIGCSFKIVICVSDGHGQGVPCGISDDSKDWQEIEFNINGCI
jgi:hypothetical protein